MARLATCLAATGATAVVHLGVSDTMVHRCVHHTRVLGTSVLGTIASVFVKAQVKVNALTHGLININIDAHPPACVRMLSNLWTCLGTTRPLCGHPFPARPQAAFEAAWPATAAQLPTAWMPPLARCGSTLRARSRCSSAASRRPPSSLPARRWSGCSRASGAKVRRGAREPMRAHG